MDRTIVFVTSTNLATNPRCLKEIQLAVKHGFSVKVMACRWGGWSEKNEHLIISALGSAVEIRYVDVTRSGGVGWLISSFLEQLCLLLFSYLKWQSLWVIAIAFSKRSWLLLRELNRSTWTPALVIAHNPGAFYPAYCFAKARAVFFAVDVEDYHPGERQPAIKRKIVLLLMSRLLPKADYTSYASPLILRRCIQSIPLLREDTCIVIRNVFWSDEFLPGKTTRSETMRLVWFSQHVDYHRGLENVLVSLDQCDVPVTLTLMGSVREEFLQKELKHRKYVKIIGPLSQQELHRGLVNYDIGLALEDSNVDENRGICLTNKILAYFQAGLYILATRTPAQELFLQEFAIHGRLFENNIHAFGASLSEIMKDWEVLNDERDKRFRNAFSHSWETESQNLLVVWNKLVLPG